MDAERAGRTATLTRNGVAASCARAVALALTLASLPGLISRPPHGPALAPLPGAEAFPPALQARLRAALDERAPPSALRTRHRGADGGPRYSNRLALESSPYLRQHAHNPVNWYPWSEEAFARARSERKPVLLSIGYSTCHWCHVMEEESFEDEEIAGVLNRDYVAIKVDREERPDLDDTYMTAVLLLTGNGGWPMTVWLTPEQQPFYAGTYFPPRAGERGVAVGFLDLLRELAAAYGRAPGQIAGHAQEVAARVARLATPAGGDALPEASVLGAAFAQYADRFDSEYGGFGSAAKFPMPGALEFLLRHHHHGGEPRALAMVTATLERMANGGIYDQIGGGFHRYATDRAWQVPHFEKMLADNALLAAAYLDAFQATGREDFARIARETLDYVARDMTAAAGGFYTASDADSDGGEGRFFVWTPAEIAAVLAPPEARAAIAYYGVTAAGNFAGASVLHVSRPVSEVASTLGQTEADLARLLAAAREDLRRVRARRPPPPTDTKIVTALNGLMISAFARGGAVLDEPRFVARARAAASFVLAELRPRGRLRRTWAEGAPHQDAFLEDYAFMIAGLLDLYDATFEPRWLEEALALHAAMIERFWDPERGGYFLTAADDEAPIVRAKPLDESALPSGNAVAAASALRLAELTGDDRLRRRAADTVRAFGPDLERAPTRAPGLLDALDGLLGRTREIAIVEPAAVERRDPRLLAAVRRTYLPDRVLTVAVEGADLARRQALIPWLADKRALGGATTAYVCERGVCALPTNDPDVLIRQLGPSRGAASHATGAVTPRPTPASD